jgi:hypothetical protein
MRYIRQWTLVLTPAIWLTGLALMETNNLELYVDFFSPSELSWHSLGPSPESRIQDVFQFCHPDLIDWELCSRVRRSRSSFRDAVR